MTQQAILRHTHADLGEIVWTAADHNWAAPQGWFLDHEDGKLESDHEMAVFENDDAAIDAVVDLAHKGDERAIRALIFNSLSLVECWAQRLMETRDA